MVAKIGGKRLCQWRAVDNDGEVIGALLQKRRNKAAARKLLRKLLKNQGVHPESIVTDGLTSYGAATSEIARSVDIAALRTVETANEVNLVGSATAETRASANAVKMVANDLGQVAGRIRGQVDQFFDRLSA